MVEIADKARYSNRSFVALTSSASTCSAAPVLDFEEDDDDVVVVDDVDDVFHLRVGYP